MKVSILTPDLSGNCFGRAWVLAKALMLNYEVEVLGPQFGEGVWAPLKGSCDFDIRSVRGAEKGRFELKKLMSLISGDIVYASKPMPQSFGMGLFAKFFCGKPLVIDIDDMESDFGREFYASLPFLKKVNDVRKDIPNLRSRYYSVALERLTWLANDVTVSGTALRGRFGGTIIRHARDGNIFRPAPAPGREEKSLAFGKDSIGKSVVGFVGSPRPHKGLEDIIEAAVIMKDEDVVFVIAGLGNDEYSEILRRKVISAGLGGKLILMPEQPFSELPGLLGAMDIVLVPQNARYASGSQVPAKIFDAMAMGKPIVATAVSDIPEILSGCGWVTGPGDPVRLAQVVRSVLGDADGAARAGRAAREKFEKEYSFEAVGGKLKKVFDGVKL